MSVLQSNHFVNKNKYDLTSVLGLMKKFALQNKGNKKIQELLFFDDIESVKKDKNNIIIKIKGKGEPVVLKKKSINSSLYNNLINKFNDKKTLDIKKGSLLKQDNFLEKVLRREASSQNIAFKDTTSFVSKNILKDGMMKANDYKTNSLNDLKNNSLIINEKTEENYKEEQRKIIDKYKNYVYSIMNTTTHVAKIENIIKKSLKRGIYFFQIKTHPYDTKNYLTHLTENGAIYNFQEITPTGNASFLFDANCRCNLIPRPDIEGDLGPVKIGDY